MYGTVIVPVDGSDESYAAVEEAVGITAPEGTVHALTVIEELPMHKRSGKGDKLEGRSDANDRERASEATEAATRLAEDADVETITAVRTGVPGREIVSYAEEVGADAIVIGKRGADEAATDMLGSTSERVLKEAPTAIVAVPRT